MTVKRNRRAGVQDRWLQKDKKTRTKQYGNGLRWRAVYVGPDGKEHSKSFRIKPDAEGWLAQQSAAVEVGTWISPREGATTFRNLAEDVMSSKATTVKPTTLSGYRSLLDTVILPRWGDVAVSEIGYDELDRWVSSLSQPGGGTRFADKGLSASRVRQAHQFVSMVLARAARTGKVPRNVADGVGLPPKAEGKQTFLTHAQVRALADAMPTDRLRALVLVLAYCGLRFGEATALTVGAVDMRHRRIAVEKSVTYVTGSGLAEGSPKNHRTRLVPIPTIAADPLAEVVDGREPGELVWPGSDGRWMTNGAFRWVFDQAVEACRAEDSKFPSLVPHDLRHTTASLAISAGANVKVLQTLLGHKTATMTLDRYGHLMADDMDAVAAAMDSQARAAVVPIDQALRGRSA